MSIEVPENWKRRSEKDAAKAIMGQINAMHLDVFEIGQLLARDHRTLQQSFMGVVLGFIESMSTNNIDPRNEQAVQFAKDIHLAFEETGRDIPKGFSFI